MPSSHRIRLTPCDYLYLTHHRSLVHRRRGGNIAWMILDADGHPEPAVVREALAGVLRTHPAAMGRLRFSKLSGRPYWQAPDPNDSVVRDAAERSHVFDDLRGVEDWPVRLDRLCQDRFVPGWNLEAGPLVRLEQYALPDKKTRFCLRWPHAFMDAEGAQWFLSELGRDPAGDRPTPPRRNPTPPDRAGRDVLEGRSLFDRLKLFRRGFRLQTDARGLTIRPLAQTGDQKLDRYRYLHRAWKGDRLDRIQTNARRLAPGGPAVYARFLAACVIRALHRLYLEDGVHTDAYAVSFPQSVTPHADQGPPAAGRPIPGNYLVSPVLLGRRDHADDLEQLGLHIQEQLETYRRGQGAAAQWAQMWAASWMRPGHYEWLLRRTQLFGTLCSGFSYYGEIARPVREIAGATITNCAGGGPLATPPGWNPTFSRFGDTLNLTLSWNEPAVSDELAHRFVALIEEQALQS